MTRRWQLTMGLSLAALLVLPGGGASGQSPDAGLGPGAVSVQGTSTLVAQIEPGDTTLVGGVLQTRGTVLVTVEEASDPRASGRATIRLDVDTYPDAAGTPIGLQVRFGWMRLENAAGAWEGRFTGRLTSRGFTQTYWLIGEGAYEGLTYVVAAGGNGPVWQSAGLIYPGRPPSGTPASPDEPAIPRIPSPLALR